MQLEQEQFECVQGVFEKRLAPMGFDYFAICSVQADDFLPVCGVPKDYLTSFPKEWVNHYMREKMYEYDPLLKAGMKTSYATDWRNLANVGNHSGKGMRVLNDAFEFGVKSGVGLAAHSLDGSVQVISLASRKEIEHSTSDLSEITAEGIRVAHEYARVRQAAKVPDDKLLSVREESCLTWAALGKSSADIAQILGISTNTVDFHIKRSMVKLESNSRVLAIVRALRMGLITL